LSQWSSSNNASSGRILKPVTQRFALNPSQSSQAFSGSNPIIPHLTDTEIRATRIRFTTFSLGIPFFRIIFPTSLFDRLSKPLGVYKYTLFLPDYHNFLLERIVEERLRHERHQRRKEWLLDELPEKLTRQA